jgi:protease-4
MQINDHIGALIYLKNKVNKWKNIAFFTVSFSIILIFKVFFNLNSDIVNEDYIASIKIEGVITEDEHRSKILKKITEDPSVKGLIVRFNSPGGTIVGSEILYQELLKIKENKPLIVLMESVAASGAYLASMASDIIVAHNGTLTGSIGVLMEAPNFSELADKVGVKYNTYKSSPLKGSPSLFEKSNPLVDKVINESIKDSYEFFVDIVKKGRKNRLDSKFYNIVFDGRVFTGRQALQYGLVDSIGGINDVEKLFLVYKLDTKKIPIKNVDIEKKDYNFINKFLNLFPFINIGAQKQQYNIMAIIK